MRRTTYCGARLRPWHRWLVVVHDLPPMPTRSEVTEAFIFRRAAEHAWRMTSISQSRNIARRWVAVTLEQARHSASSPEGGGS